MLNEKQIKHVVMAAMARYSAENPGKRGLSRTEVTNIVSEYGGDANDVNAAILEGMKRMMPEEVRWHVC